MDSLQQNFWIYLNWTVFLALFLPMDQKIRQLDDNCKGNFGGIHFT